MLSAREMAGFLTALLHAWLLLKHIKKNTFINYHSRQYKKNDFVTRTFVF